MIQECNACIMDVFVLYRSLCTSCYETCAVKAMRLSFSSLPPDDFQGKHYRQPDVEPSTFYSYNVFQSKDTVPQVRGSFDNWCCIVLVFNKYIPTLTEIYRSSLEYIYFMVTFAHLRLPLKSQIEVNVLTKSIIVT